MIWLGAMLIALPGVAADCEPYAFGDSLNDEVYCWRQSYDVWTMAISEALSRIYELEAMIQTLAGMPPEGGVPTSVLFHAADFGRFDVGVPAGWIVDVSAGEPYLAGVAVPVGVLPADLGVSTLIMTHPDTDEDPEPLVISVTASPRMGGTAQHMQWEDIMVTSLLPQISAAYGGAAYWEDLGSERLDTNTYIRYGGLEVHDIMAYRSAVYVVFDTDAVYYVGLSAPPHLYEPYRNLLDAVYGTFEIN